MAGNGETLGEEVCVCVCVCMCVFGRGVGMHVCVQVWWVCVQLGVCIRGMEKGVPNSTSSTSDAGVPGGDEGSVGPAESAVVADELQQLRTPGELTAMGPVNPSTIYYTHYTHHHTHTLYSTTHMHHPHTH